MTEDAGQVQAAEVLLKKAALLYEKDEEDCRRLLADAAVLYERHQAGRGTPFNVFTVLRSGSDEVNLHSRFLKALLDHRKAPDAPRANLEDFLKNIVDCGDFDLSGVTVERERDNIDILVTNTARQAVVIENKIWAGDQPEQLQRYHESLKERGFEDGNIRLLYLTPHDRNPSEDSQGDLDVACISYAHTLPPWLERCQERAYAEPGLRESIEQYLNLVRELTGTDWTEGYMTELKNLCIEGNNPRLIHDLAEALTKVKIDLLRRLCEGIEETVKKKIPGLYRSLDELHRIEGYVRHWNNCWWFSLGYTLKDSSALLSFGVDEHHLHYGIRCDRGQTGYDEIKAILHDSSRAMPGECNDKWPWYRGADSSVLPENFKRKKLELLEWENVEFLLDEERKQKLADKIAQDLAQVWQIWEDAHK